MNALSIEKSAEVIVVLSHEPGVVVIRLYAVKSPEVSVRMKDQTQDVDADP